MYDGYTQSLQRYDTTMPEAITAPILGPVLGGGSSFGQALLGSAINGGMDYLGSRLKLGSLGSGNTNTDPYGGMYRSLVGGPTRVR